MSISESDLTKDKIREYLKSCPSNRIFVQNSLECPVVSGYLQENFPYYFVGANEDYIFYTGGFGECSMSVLGDTWIHSFIVNIDSTPPDGYIDEGFDGSGMSYIRLKTALKVLEETT